MKRINATHLLLLILVAALLSLPLCGCGGSSSSHSSGPTPNYDALFGPYLGTYSVVSTANPDNASSDFTLTLAMGTGHYYGASVPVVTMTTPEPKNVFYGRYANDWNEGKAYLKNATLSADGTQITQLVLPTRARTIRTASCSDCRFLRLRPAAC